MKDDFGMTLAIAKRNIFEALAELEEAMALHGSTQELIFQTTGICVRAAASRLESAAGKLRGLAEARLT